MIRGCCGCGPRRTATAVARPADANPRASSAIWLQGSARHHHTGELVSWRIEGMLDDGEITVCARFNGYSGNFMLTRAGTRPRLARRSIRSQLGALGFRLRGLLTAR